jgi:hypothetical protein
MTSNMNYIKKYTQANFDSMNITDDDFKYLSEFDDWVGLMGEYIYTRGYAKKYYTIIFQAVKLRILDKLNSDSVLAGDLEYEFERVSVLVNKTG